MKELNRIRTYGTFLLLIIVLFLLLVLVHGSLNNQFENSDTIVFLGNDRIAPIIYKEKGKAKGVAVDIAKELGEKIGFNIEVETTDWLEAQNMVLRDSMHPADLINEADRALYQAKKDGRNKVVRLSELESIE